jgi:lysophospholipase L1-like esterase
MRFGIAALSGRRLWRRLAASATACAVLFAVVGCEPEDGLGQIAVGASTSGGWADFDFGSNNTAVYVCLGDSITDESGYPAMLEQMLGQGRTVINEGRGGEESAGGLVRVNGVLGRYTPGYLLVLYGANDVMHGVSGSAIVENLRQIVRSALANQTLPVVATMTPMPRSVRQQEFVDAVNGEIIRMAQEEGVPLVDLGAILEGAGYELFPDGLHPNREAAEKIASGFFALLSQL